ncbi:MAG TPA: hypothetical protein DD730_09865 [Desulfosporosinus sp.]|jgi:hypothetical protein|nr:hypothetical protein [Desulfosporosinus sp.]
MNKSESIIKIAPALLKAQREIGAATKGSTNPFFHSSYADLGAVMEACKDKLNLAGIAVLQPVGTDEVGVYVETLLLHKSGEYISDKMRLSVKEENNPQAQGSAITYARRYSLQSMLFIPAEDDDGEKAMSRLYDKPGEKPSETREKVYSLICNQCGDPITTKVASWSMATYKTELCMSCQKKVDKPAVE